MQYQWTEWDEDVESTPDEEYRSLVRSLRRKIGFGLFFVRCSPVGGQELIERVRTDVPQKQADVLELKEPISNLIDLVKIFPNIDNIKILFVVGLEKSLVEYIRTGYGGQGDYYNLDIIPPILSHLNWQRENFRDKFRHICFVFLLPRFAIKYIIRRAPDFYDWASGKTDIPSSQKLVAQESQRILIEGDYEKYLEWNPQKRKERIIEIDELLLEQAQSQNQQVSLLLFEQGNIFSANKQYEEAIASYDCALEIKPNDHEAWNNRGVALGNLGRNEEAIASYNRAIEIKPDHQDAWYNLGSTLDNLGRYEEAIDSYDRALEIKPDYHEVWLNRGSALFHLGRYEEAIDSYDRALEIKPDLHEVWLNRSIVLFHLGRYEEAINSYDRALEIKPDHYEGWYDRGVVLFDLGRNEEAIASYNRALEIKPDLHEAWCNRGVVLGNLGRNEEAINCFDRAVKIKPNLHEAWRNRGIALSSLGRTEESMDSYDRALKIQPQDHLTWYNRGNTLGNLGRYEESIASYDRALEIKPDLYEAWYNKACNYSLQNQIEPALENMQKAIQLNPEKYCETAKTDSDFDNIRHDPRFQALIQ